MPPPFFDPRPLFCGLVGAQLGGGKKRTGKFRFAGKEMKQDVSEVESLMLELHRQYGFFPRKDATNMLWIGEAGSVTPAHFDMNHNCKSASVLRCWSHMTRSFTCLPPCPVSLARSTVLVSMNARTL